MTRLTLYYHPLSSYCWKALIALYETQTPFTPHLVDFGDPKASADFARLWPIRKFPVLREDDTGRIIPESSIIGEYLAQHARDGTSLIPSDPDLARETRLRDRIFDCYIHNPMQKIVADILRPADKKDPFGVEEAGAGMDAALGVIDAQMADRHWAIGETFTLADCAAAPALYYANRVAPFGDVHRSSGLYLERLMQRPSFARVLKEAEPYFKFFPGDAKR